MDAPATAFAPASPSEAAPLRIVQGRDLAGLIPGFVAGLSDFALQQRFAAHHDRADAVRLLLAQLDEPSPARSFMAVDAQGAPLAHLHAAFLGNVGEAGWTLLEIARVAAVVGRGHGRWLLEQVRPRLGASLLCSCSSLGNPRLAAMARNAFPLVYSPRVTGLVNLPAALLQAQPSHRLRDHARARAVVQAALHLQVPAHVAGYSLWQPIAADDLQRLWQRCQGGWRLVEERLVGRAAERLKRMAMPHTAKVLPQAFRAVYGRELAAAAFRQVGQVQRQRIVDALVKDGLLR